MESEPWSLSLKTQFESNKFVCLRRSCDTNETSLVFILLDNPKYLLKYLLVHFQIVGEGELLSNIIIKELLDIHNQKTTSKKTFFSYIIRIETFSDKY